MVLVLVVSLAGRDEWLSQSTAGPTPRPRGGPALLPSTRQMRVQPADLVCLQRYSDLGSFVPKEYPGLGRKGLFCPEAFIKFI